MHIPDGWLSIGVSLLTWGFTLIALALAFARLRRDDIDKISNIGAISAVIFVAQMFNFPIAAGTSGHMLGASLAVFVVGLPGAIISLFVVLFVQAVVFADGGLLALGANTFNMGVIGALVAYMFLRAMSNNSENKRVYYGGIFGATLFAVVFSSLFAGFELVASGVTTLGVSIPPILAWHLIIGIGEGLLTIFIISYLHQVDFPMTDLRSETSLSLSSAVSNSNKPLLGLGVLVLLLSTLALFASSSPDGLEFVGINLNFGEGSAFELGLADDYQFLGITSFLGTVLSALLGVVIIAGLMMLPPLYLRDRRATTA